MSRQCHLFVSIVVLLCLSVGLGTAWAALSVEIITPDTDPYQLGKDVEQEFEAVAYLDGQELESGQVSWEWDFDDGSDPVLLNPTDHSFDEYGIYIVTVTASYQGQSATDDVIVIVSVASDGNTGSWVPRPGWWLMCPDISGHPSAVIQHSQGENRHTQTGLISYDEAYNSGVGWSEGARGYRLGGCTMAEAEVCYQGVWNSVHAHAMSGGDVSQWLIWDGGERPLHGRYTISFTWMHHNRGDLPRLGTSWATPLFLPDSYAASGSDPIGGCFFEYEGYWDKSTVFTCMFGSWAEVWHEGNLLPEYGSCRQVSNCLLTKWTFETLE